MSKIFQALNENSLADQIMQAAKQAGLNPRLRGTPEQERERTQKMLAQRAKDREMAPKPTYSPEQIEQLKQQLEKAQQGFDANYEYSDDHRYWSTQRDKAQLINSIKRQLHAAGANLTESIVPNTYKQVKSLLSELDNRSKQQIIKTLTKDLQLAESGHRMTVSEILNELALENKHSKEVDYDDPEWDAMVKRVGQLAKQGERKTVYDPDKRVYKTVPVNPPKEQGVAEGKEEKIAQLKKDYETAVHWSKNARSPQEREEYRRKALKIKNHLEKQFKQGVAEGKPQKKADRYHINKDGKPATLASYPDKDSAVKDRDSKYPDAKVHQVGPRGKVKGEFEEGVAEGLVGDVVVHNYTKIPIDLEPGQAQIAGWGPNDEPLYRVKGQDGKEVKTWSKRRMLTIAKEQGVAEAFGPLPRKRQQIRLGRHTVDIERVGLDNDYISFAWHDSQGQDHYQEVPVGDLGSYDDLIDRIKDEIRYQERQYTDQGVAEGLPQTLRKVVPGYAKREIDKKMDAGKFGKTDADKDANFQRYKKIQDKIKEQGVAEGSADKSGIII